MMGGAGPEVVDDLLAKLTSLRTLEVGRFWECVCLEVLGREGSGGC